VLNFDQSSVKYTLQNTENYSHQWLSDSSRVHVVSFPSGLRPEAHWGSLLRSAKSPSRLGTGISPPNTPTTKVARSLRLRCSFGSNRPLPTQTPQLTQFPPKTEGTRINAALYILRHSEKCVHWSCFLSKAVRWLPTLIQCVFIGLQFRKLQIAHFSSYGQKW